MNKLISAFKIILPVLGIFLIAFIFVFALKFFALNIDSMLLRAVLCIFFAFICINTIMRIK